MRVESITERTEGLWPGVGGESDGEGSKRGEVAGR